MAIELAVKSNRIKIGQIILALVIGIVIGTLGGLRLATFQAQMAILAGPYSDNYEPALAAISEAKVKLQSGDTNVVKYLNSAQSEIEKAQQWSRRFLGRKGDQANDPESHR